MNLIEDRFLEGFVDELHKLATCEMPLRYKTKKKTIMGKKAGLFSGEGKARAEKLRGHIQAAGGDVKAGVKAYNDAMKKGKKGREKKAAVECDTPGEKLRSKGRGRGLVRGEGKGPFGKPGGFGGGGRGLGIRAKIEAARRDPSTKEKPKDTGPAGSGTADPRFKSQKFRKAAMEILKNATNGLAFSPAAIRRGSSRIGGKTKTPPTFKTKLQRLVTEHEGREFFRTVGRKRTAS